MRFSTYYKNAAIRDTGRLSVTADANSPIAPKNMASAIVPPMRPAVISQSRTNINNEKTRTNRIILMTEYAARMK